MKNSDALRLNVLHAEKKWDSIVDAPVFGMAADFPDARKELAEHEGGNDDDPADPGGRTSRGVIQAEYDRYRKRKGLSARDVWKADDAEVDEIYRTEYWAKLHGDDLPAGVDYAVFDYGVHSGISRSAEVLQRYVGADIDGDIGAETLRLAAAAVPVTLINDICDQRMAFLRGLKTFGRFGGGWTTRVKAVRALSLKMAANAPVAAERPTAGWLSVLAGMLMALLGRAPTKPAPAPSPPVMNPHAELPWMTWGAKEVGFHETGQNRNIGRYTGPAKCGQEGDPWCAIWVNAGFESVGIRGTRSAMARSFEHDPNFVKLDGPAFGAVTTLWRGSPGSGQGHVFFYIGENERGILALGGNQSDQVCRQYEPRNRVVGYWWPKSVPLPKIGAINVTGDANEGTET